MDAPAADVSPTALDWHTIADITTAAVLPDGIEEDAAAILDAVDATIIDDAAKDQSRLSDRQLAILEFERQWWRQQGAKEQAIRERFEMSPTRYYQALNALLDLPQALSYDPTLVHRLQRLRTSALRARRLR